jgi:4-amino-4-deoxy-L-arabinose transferase-like glycosyltransferase
VAVVVGCTVLGALLAYAALVPPTALHSGVVQHPPQLVFRNFYGAERNGFGAYRWSKPDASIGVPLAAPAAYRVTLTLQDSPAAPPRRAVSISLNGAAAGTVFLDETPRDYTFVHQAPARAWAGGQRTLQIEIRADAFVAPADQRPLGVIVSGLAIEPVPPATPPWPALLGPLVLLVAVYGALRGAGLGTAWALTVVGGGVAAYGALAATDRSAALALACQPVARPAAAATALLLLAALPLLVRAVAPAPAPPQAPVGATAGAAQTPTGQGIGGRAATASTWPGRLPASLPLLGVLALAGGLRLYHAMARSLWFDEGATIYFAQLPWRRVLGLQGQYEPHPPLFYATVKLLSLALPQVGAGRLLSILTGTLTVGVVYALTARLAGRASALLAGLVLAVSPLHVWYSQEARMYAPAALLVCLSYLALIGYDQAADCPARRRWWALVYGGSTLLAMYTVYSSFYSLLPQVPLLALIVRRHGRRALALEGAAVAAVAGYLPWVPQAFAGLAAIGDRSRALGATPAAIQATALAVGGLGGEGIRGESFYPGLWERAPAWPWHYLLSAVVATVATVGTVALGRRAALALWSPVALLAGTLGTAILVSQVSPGFAPRTVLVATIGWAMLAGAAAAVTGPAWLRLVARGAVTALLVASVLTLGLQYRDGYKQPYREAVRATEVAATFGQPVVAIGYLTAFVDAYAPQLRYEHRPYLAAVTSGTAGAPDAFWMVYAEHPWEEMDAVRAQLTAAGYARLLHQRFDIPLYLDLYARPTARLGHLLPIDDSFATSGGWQLPPSGALVLEEAGARRLALANAGDRVIAATLDAPAAPGRLYQLRVEAQPRLETGRPGVSLSCLGADGATLAITADEAAETAQSGEDWQTHTLAALCPPGTARARVALENRGVGEVRFRAVELREVDAARH